MRAEQLGATGSAGESYLSTGGAQVHEDDARYDRMYGETRVPIACSARERNQLFPGSGT